VVVLGQEKLTCHAGFYYSTDDSWEFPAAPQCIIIIPYTAAHIRHAARPGGVCFPNRLAQVYLHNHLLSHKNPERSPEEMTAVCVSGGGRTPPSPSSTTGTQVVRYYYTLRH
jgi:hypothetical protein